MGQQTAIAWTDHTFNIAWGCFKISPGCKHCYADTFSTKRVGLKVFGPPATTPRQTFGEAHWHKPELWNRQAARAGVRRRVFSSSMCDIFEDHPSIDVEREKLWALIRRTPALDWQLLTKRTERIAARLPADWGQGYANVWLGTSVENQEYADRRLPQLLATPARTRFLSVEPLLGPVDLAQSADLRNLHWVIVGGESGPGYRPMDHAWARAVRDRCVEGGVAFFMKQSAAPRTEMGTYLVEADGSKWAWKQYPRTPFEPAGRFDRPVRVAA